jgi:anaerobic magnesium-protoporphyrin IX monomethyl ester cyclase
LEKFNVALINVMKVGDFQYEQEIPLGLAYIGAFLRKNGYQVTFHQCIAGHNQEEINNASRVVADIYGFQLNIGNYLEVKAVVKEIKTKNPKAITILGGPFLVSLSEDILKNEPLFDFIVIGEGEETVVELLEAIERKQAFSNIKGLVWRDQDQNIIKNEPRTLIENLDELPFPARDFLEDAQRDPIDNGIVESVRMVTSRGCIGRCSFCCVNFYNKVQKGKVWRGRSPKNVVDELEYLGREYNVRLFNFADSSFDDAGESGKLRSREICEEIIKREIPFSAKIYLRCETMKSHEDIELLKLYKKAGIDIIIIGAESGSDYELRFYEKRATVEDNFRIAKILRDLDLFYVLTGFIMFGPNSTLETLRNNIEFLYKFGFADNLMLVSNVLMLISDSKLYKLLEAENRLIKEGNFWELPKYKFNDSLAERMTKHWLNLFIRYPVTNQVNKLQVNTGNLIARMTNPMNSIIFDRFKDEFLELKSKYMELSSEFGKLQYEYFIYTLELIKNNSSDQKLDQSADRFFGVTYSDYLPIYDQLYNNFLEKVVDAGYSLSGLVFKHFVSLLGTDHGDRVKAKVSNSITKLG